MSKPFLVFVESNTTGTGRLFVRAAVSSGHQPVLLTAKPSQYDFLAEKRLKVVETDTSDEETVFNKCSLIAEEKEGLAGIGSSSEYFISTAASVAKRLGLPGPDPLCVSLSRNKQAQRSLLKAAGMTVPEFRVAGSPQQALDAAKTLGMPVVIKPLSGSGSVGVKLCADEKEVTKHSAFLLKQTTNERGLRVFRQILVEQLASGPEFSVEILSAEVIGVTKKYLGAAPYFVEIGHDFPATVSKRRNKVLTGAALGAIGVLGLGFGPAHVELRITEIGPTIIEVNPRLAGGYIPELVRLAIGVNLISETIGLLTGAPQKARKTKKSRFASIRFLLPPAGGRLTAVEGLDEAALIPNVVEARLYKQVGEQVQRLGNYHDRAGHVIACAEQPGDARSGADRAAALINLLVDENSVELEKVGT